jgi:roadblock/LC7 domain-containing protein
MVDEITSQPYSNLIIEDDETVVGRVFHSSKTIVIDDVELQAALNYLSNRNYTLPAPLVSTTSTADSSGGLQSGVTYYITYQCRDNSPYTAGTQYGTTLIQPLHCRYIQEITPSKSGYKFRIQSPASVWYDTTSRAASNGTGFTAPVVDVLIASAATGTSLAYATWFYSGNIGSYASLNSGIEVAFNTGSTTMGTFTGYTTSGNSYLTYGDDPILVAYFSATAQSTIYKMSATLVAKNNEFNQTQNDTYSSTTNESVYITEAALYNENNELLMTGKLNTAIEKNDKKFVTIKMELDL